MMRLATLVACLALPAAAQDQEVAIRVQGATDAPEGAVLRGLDRINGTATDIELQPGVTTRFERLDITLRECKFPEGQRQTEAFAYLTIRDIREEFSAFDGWMFASSPALSSLDHPRYDVWVVRCKT